MVLNSRDKVLRFFASGIIVAMLLLQGSMIAFMVGGNAVGTWFWPIIDYPMYSGAHQEGDYIKQSIPIEVVTENGAVTKVTANDVGLNFWKFLYIGTGILKSSQKSADLLVSLLPYGDVVTEIRAYSSPYIITKNGKADVQPVLLNTMIMKNGKDQ